MTFEPSPPPRGGLAAPTPRTRREFVAACGGMLGGGWLALGLPALATLAACSRDAAWNGEPLVTLKPAEALAMAAFAARILPSDELPGAEEAGVLHFVDRALGSLYGEHLEPVRAGLSDLDRRARSLDPEAGGFAALSFARQVEVMEQVEDTPFFGTARMLVLAGVFSDPAHGGNRDGVGWRLIGMEHAGSHQPPFGYYDAAYAGATGVAT